MKHPLVADLVEILSRMAPPALAEEWDAVGLQLGDPSRPVARTMVALDPTNDVVDQAVTAGCTLLVTHHPLIFRPVARIVSTDPAGAVILRAAAANLAIFVMHTNFDSVRGGLNDLLARVAGLIDSSPLVPAPSRFVKLVVFVPAGHGDRVRAALSPFAAPIGDYVECTFRVGGTGTFRPLPGASPFVGEIGELEEVDELRLEILIEREKIDQVLEVLRRVHPYEEPAFDIHPVSQADGRSGLGRFGSLPEPAPLDDYARHISASLGVPVRVYGDGSRPVRTVAVCSGSGKSLIRASAARGADLLLTGDIGHHDALDAEMRGLSLIDAGHFGTERIMVSAVARTLREETALRGYQVDILEAVEHPPHREIHADGPTIFMTERGHVCTDRSDC